MRDQNTTATRTGSPVPGTGSSHVTLPAGWGSSFPGSRDRAVRVRPTRQADAPTTVHPLVPASADDDPLGIYRPASPVSEPRPDRPAAPHPVVQNGLEQVRKVAGTTRATSHGLGLRGHEVIAGAGASALASIVTSSLGIGGTPFGSAMTSMVIAIAGAVFARMLTRDRGGHGEGTAPAQPGRKAAEPARGRLRGVFIRTVGVALVLTLGTGIVGAIFLSKEVGGSFGQQLINISSSGYRVRQMWEQAWPFLKEAWRAAIR